LAFIFSGLALAFIALEPHLGHCPPPPSRYDLKVIVPLFVTTQRFPPPNAAAKSRHPGESRGPDSLQVSGKLDSGFRRNDEKSEVTWKQRQSNSPNRGQDENP